MKEDLTSQVKRMAEYLDNEAIARALKIEVETVESILEGTYVAKAVPQETKAAQPVVVLQKTAYKQKVIAVCRAKGGVGATSMAVNLAAQISQYMPTLLIDRCASFIGDIFIVSDALDYLKIDPYALEASEPVPEIREIQKNLYYLPCHPDFNIREIVLEAREKLDAIVIDTPYPAPEDALNTANTIVIVTAFGQSESYRLQQINHLTIYKDTLLVGVAKPQNAEVAEELKESLNAKTVLPVPFDPSYKGGLIPRKSPVYAGIEKLISHIYGHPLKGDKQQSGLLEKLFAKS